MYPDKIIQNPISFAYLFLCVFFCYPLIAVAQMNPSPASSSTEVPAEGGWNSSILYADHTGRIIYHSDEEANRIPDFSHAGYRGGGVALPHLPVKITLDPSPTGDDTEQIQQAIEDVAAMPEDASGHRGAVKLNPGDYHITSPILINHSGVVLRGAGNGSDPATNTIIHGSKEISNFVMRIGNRANWSMAPGSPVTDIVSEKVTVGSRNFEVEDAAGFEPGDDIIIFHPVTWEWIEAVEYGGAPEDDPNPWTPDNSNLNIQKKRQIIEINGNTIRIDVPVYNHLERSLSQSYIFKPDTEEVVRESGIEQFRMVIESDGPEADDHTENGIFFDGVENCWADAVTIMHYRIYGIATTNSNFVTIQHCHSLEPHSPIDGARRYNFSVNPRSNNILFKNNIATEGRHCYVSNGTASVSGVVFLHSSSSGAHAASEGHRRWSQGLLYDNITFKDPNVDVVLGLYNRRHWGTRHGWSSAHSVAWNCNAGPDGQIIVQKPPTAQNYGIGNQGTTTGEWRWDALPGFIEGTGESLQIPSLYEAQLDNRTTFGLPPDAPFGLTVTPHEEFQYFKLEWKHIPIQEMALIIERSVDGGDTFEHLATISTDERVYIDEVIDLESYAYRIAASREGWLSAWSNVAGFNIKMPPFLLRNPSTGTKVGLAENPDNNLSFWWNEVEDNDLDITYTWFLDSLGGDFSDPILERNLDLRLIQIPHHKMDGYLRDAGVDSGATFHGKWTARANAHPDLEVWAAKPFYITLKRGHLASSAEEEEELPKTLHLSQNYPNPFNPVTVIDYALPVESDIQLEVFDILGRRVAIVAKGVMPAGRHTVTFDASRLAGGVYIYRLQAKDKVLTRRMTLVK